jgi:hypothetical protein
MLKKNKDKPSAIDEAIDRVLETMKETEPDSDEYGFLIARLDKLHSIKIAEKVNQNRVSADAVVTIAANLFGIILILGFERAHVVTSKALGFVMKPKA